jgi:hypothetical protein
MSKRIVLNNLFIPDHLKVKFLSQGLCGIYKAINLKNNKFYVVLSTLKNESKNTYEVSGKISITRSTYNDRGTSIKKKVLYSYSSKKRTPTQD